MSPAPAPAASVRRRSPSAPGRDPHPSPPIAPATAARRPTLPATATRPPPASAVWTEDVIAALSYGALGIASRMRRASHASASSFLVYRPELSPLAPHWSGQDQEVCCWSTVVVCAPLSRHLPAQISRRSAQPLSSNAHVSSPNLFATVAFARPLAVLSSNRLLLIGLPYPGHRLPTSPSRP